MSTTVTSNLVSKLTATETTTSTNPASSSTTLTSTLASNKSLGPSTSQPVTKQWSGQVTLIAGVASLDLTALTRDVGATVNADGLRLLALKVQGDAANTSPVTLKPGATNGYDNFGLGLSVKANDEILVGPLNAATAVDGTHKTLDLASAMAAAKVTILMTFGTVV